MMNNWIIMILAILVPVLCGLGIMIKPEWKKRNTLLAVTGA